MFLVSIDEEFLDHLTAKATFWKHSPNGAFDQFDRIFFKHDARRTGAKTTIVSRNVVVVLLGFWVVTGELHFGSVDDDNIISSVDVWSVGGLIFAHEDNGDFRSKAAKGDAFCINDVPFAIDVVRVSHCGLTLHCFDSFILTCGLLVKCHGILNALKMPMSKQFLINYFRSNNNIV